MDTRYGRVSWGPNGTRQRTSENNWRQPLLWNRRAEKAGERRRVFCASLADVFEDRDELHGWREDLFKLIDETRWLDWLLLTKRPEKIQYLHRIARGYSIGDYGPIPNLWLGTSVENQEAADDRIPHLLQVPAVVRFLSCEPLLGPIELREWHLFHHIAQLSYQLPQVDWVIVGGESGPHARPMATDWARSLRDQCQAAGVAFHFKQWGEWAPIDPGDYVNCSTFCELDGKRFAKIGKHAAGRLLDGIEHNGYPITPEPA